MKYYLITEDMRDYGSFKNLVGTIYAIVRHPKSGRYVLTPINNLSCAIGTYFSPFEGTSPKAVENIYFKKGLKDVTEIYYKIKAVIKVAEKNKIVNGLINPIDVLYRFENGLYPIPIEFEAMNNIWKLLKQ